MSVQLQALADEVFDAAAALDLVAPPWARSAPALASTLAAPGGTNETQAAMVQVFTEISSSSGGGRSQIPSPSGGGQGGGFSILPVQSEEAWVAFEGLLRADAAEPGRTDAATAQVTRLYRWRAANTAHRFYLANDGDRAVARVGLFQHRTTAYLEGLFTHPDFRQRGAGSFLTQAMEAEARAVGCERVALLCTRESGLRAYFERLGFRVVGERS
ncbi:MAG TPA: GNAT family N-acetyltransferase [Candidatus Dormibacteraeota bacterium]